MSMMNLYHKKAKIVIDYTCDRMRDKILDNVYVHVHVHVLKNYSYRTHDMVALCSI